MKDPIEVQPPGGDRVFIIPRVEYSGGYISFTSFDYVPPDFRHSSAVEGSLSESADGCMNGSAHVVNCPIASSTD